MSSYFDITNTFNNSTSPTTNGNPSQEEYTGRVSTTSEIISYFREIIATNTSSSPSSRSPDNNSSTADLDFDRAIKDSCLRREVINEDFMKFLFLDASQQQIKEWTSSLADEELLSVTDLSSLDIAAWNELKLPSTIRNMLRERMHEAKETLTNTSQYSSGSSSILSQLQPPAPEMPMPISQIDIVVIDISGSMTSRSSVDVDKTREDVSKMLFHTIIDKLISLELCHAVGLLAFGQKVTPIAITREYESFHDELGRLNANEGATMLYDAIYSAADMIENYLATDNSTAGNDGSDVNASSKSSPSADLVKRIFVLTDGDDNASRRQPWEVAQYLQQKNIILDAIPVAGLNTVLYSMCRASGGLYFDVVSQEQIMNVFEREATLHASYREAPGADEGAIPAITSASVLQSLQPANSQEIRSVTTIASAVPQKVYARCMTTAEILAQQQQDDSSSSSSPAQSQSSSQSQSQSQVQSHSSSTTKRVMKEYLEFQKTPIDGFQVFVNADDVFSWKVVLKDLPAPYSGGIWLLTLDFPRNYPFSAPRFKFITPIYHCNISPDGYICLDTIKENWSPSHTVRDALQGIRSLLLAPNANDPLDAFKATVYRDYIQNVSNAYMEEASKHTMEHAGKETWETFLVKYNLGPSDDDDNADNDANTAEEAT